MRLVLAACLLATALSTVVGQAVAEEEAPRPRAAASPSPVHWLDKITLSGVLDVESRWRQYSNFLIPSSGTASDLYVRQLSLGVEACLLQSTSAIVVFNSEWIDDDLNQGNGEISLDEVHLDTKGTVYLVVGKRPQPFGQFESDLVTDPTTQDAYQANRVGATGGVSGPWCSDVSATVYKGTAQMDQLFDSGLFDAGQVQRETTAFRNIDSFIASAQACPWTRHLTIFAAWLSEPGHGNRNTSADAGFAFVPPCLSNLTLNLEYVRALSRELYVGLPRQYKDKVLSTEVSYAFAFRERLLFGRRDYRGRRAGRSAHPIVAAARYEIFDDDGLASAANSWSLRDRASLGARYAVRSDGDVLAYVQTEVRRNGYRGKAIAHDHDTEVYALIGVDF